MMGTATQRFVCHHVIIILIVATGVKAANESQTTTTSTTTKPTTITTSTDDPDVPLFFHPALRNILQSAVQILTDELRGVRLPAKGTHNKLLESLARQNVDPLRILRRFLTQNDIREVLPKPEAVNQRCYDDVVDFIDALIGQRQNASSNDYVTTDWAAKMIDSYGKPTAALLRGALHWTGNYEQCLDVHAFTPVGTFLGSGSTPRKTSSQFDGQYCRVQILVHIPAYNAEEGLWADLAKRPFQLSWGTCFPESCEPNDVKNLLTEGILSVAALSVSGVSCFDKDVDLGSDGWAIFTICLYGVIGAIVITCTILESAFYHGYHLNSPRGTDEEKDTKVGKFQRFGTPNGLTSSSVDYDVIHGRSLTNGDPGNARVQLGAPNMTTPLSVDKKSKDVLGLGDVAPDKVKNGPTKVGKGMRLLQAFSLRYNIAKLLSTSQVSGPDELHCIQGLRVISILWIVLGHTYLGGLAGPSQLLFTPLDEVRNVLSRMSFMIVRSAVQAVDTFFVISGLLVMKITLRYLRETEGPRGRFWTVFIIHRIWRITPVYMVVILTGTHLYDHLVEGPLKADPSFGFGACPDNWWYNILYVNNLFDPKDMCMSWSWFLAVDMQLYTLSPIFIYLVYKKYRVGLAVLVATVILGTLATILITLNNPGSFLTHFLLQNDDYSKHVYLSTWPRIPVYALGMLAGVILEDMADKFTMSKLKALCVWVMLLALVVFFMLIPHDEVKGEGDLWPKGVTALYEGFSHLVWGLFIVWVIFACQSGLGGIANTVLTWPAFQPLARLTFTVYLVHPLVSTLFLNNRNYPVDLQDTVMIYMYCGDVIMSFLFALFLTLMFESPLMTLEKILLQRK